MVLWLCSNEHTVVSDPALGQPISRTVKKSQAPAGTLSAPPELRAGRLDRVDRAQWLPTLVELLGVWLTAVAVNAVALI